VCAPQGDLPGWKQLFVTDFPGTVPLGAFSDCNNEPNTPWAVCNGLQNYGDYFDNWWAYPSGWPDTAKSGADGNAGAPFGGVYRPEVTVSVSDGALHIHMFRPSSGGENAVGTVVPRKCMDQQYGRYSERFKVVHADPGFKSAHLFYQGGYEIDYPENDYGGTISANTHPAGTTFGTAAKWSDWHTTDIEWTANAVKFYLDGVLIGTATEKVPRTPMSWVLQNESSILGPYAAPGAWAQLDIAWVSCYAPSSGSS
jgi:beta-glucanase (GH16 family)